MKKSQRLIKSKRRISRKLPNYGAKNFYIAAYIPEELRAIPHFPIEHERYMPKYELAVEVE